MSISCNRLKYLSTLLHLALVISSKNCKAIINFSNNHSTISINGASSQLILGANLSYGGTLRIPNYTSGTSITQTNTNNILTYSSDAITIFNGFESSVLGTTTTVTMTGSQSLNLNPGTVIDQPVNISGVNNAINGSATFSQPITLADSNTVLNIGLNGKLTNNIVLNGGTVNLTQDLLLKDDVILSGTGTINCNGFSLVFPVYSSAITGNLTFHNANDIIVSTRTLLTGTWNFTGATNNLRGTGVIVDLTGGGTISIGSGTAMYANGVHIKGLGATGGGTITFGNSTSKMYLTNCTLELAGTYTQTQGQMIVEGTTCKIIADQNDKYIISGATSILQVDGQILEYLSINKLSSSPISTASGGTITLSNGGDIRSAAIPGAASKISANLATGSGANTTDSTIDLSSGTTLTFVNSTPASPKAMTFDGNNNSVIFGENASAPFILQNNVNLTVQNVKFQNFDPAKISLGTSATITYGDNVIFEIAKSVSLSTSALTLTGNVTIQGRGQGAMLNVASQAITLTGASKTLTIRGVRVRNNAVDSIKLNTASAKLSLQAMDFYMTSPGFTFATGNIEFKDDVNLVGASETTPEALTTFSFTSAGLGTILSGSKLKMWPDTKLLYNPDVTGDGGVASVQKRHFKTTDPSSILQMQHASIDASNYGIALDYGKFIIEELANITTSYTSGKEFELGTSTNTTILTSGVLNVDGHLKYVTTTYP